MNPFAQLLGIGAPARLPGTTNATLVVDGRRLTDARQLVGRANPTADIEQDPIEAEAELVRNAWEQARLKAELNRVKNAARYQRARQCPEKMAKRQAWYEANAERLREYRREYRAKNKQRTRELQTAWAKRRYHADPAAQIAASKKYYAAHRQEILAKKKAQRDAAKAAAAAASPAQPTDPQPTPKRKKA